MFFISTFIICGIQSFTYSASTGGLSRDELSALLLVYVGLAADIIELFEIFNEENVLKNSYFILAVLAIWSWSLMQFGLSLGGSGSGQGTRISDVHGPSAKPVKCYRNVEIWTVILSVVFQDGPFFAIRLTAIIMFNVFTHSNYFFTAKNLLVIILQGYRLIVLTCYTGEQIK